MRTRYWIAFALAAAAAGATLGWIARGPGDAPGAPAAAPAEPEALYWYDPMRPEVHFDAPGKSPFMDMDLVPMYAQDPATGGTTVQIDPRMAQNLGIRTAPATRETFSTPIEAVGAVEHDERRVYAVVARAEGWVERLHVRAVGAPVQRGQRLAGVYAPALFAAQEELALAARSGDADLTAASRQRLRLLGADAAQIDEVLRSGRAQRHTGIHAPADGVVLELNVQQGQKVPPDMPLMRIADLSQLWLTLEVPEAQAGALQAGQAAEARFAALPGRRFAGQVEYVYPRLDPATRTVRARLVFPNQDGALKPGMYAAVSIHGAGREDAVRVPAEAVIRTGRRTVVLVAEGEGRFRPVEVTLGAEHDGRIVVVDGLQAGDEVVTSGQFLLDSEASLRGLYRHLDDAPAGDGHAGHGSGGASAPPEASTPQGGHDGHGDHDGHDGSSR